MFDEIDSGILETIRDLLYDIRAELKKDNDYKYNNEFVFGKRYEYFNAHLCYNNSLNAIRAGHKVKYGITSLGKYYFEIVNPF